MKPYRIVIFIFSVIACLALMAAFFPEEGLKVGKTVIRFPSLEQIMTREEPAAKVEDLLVRIDTVLQQEKLKEQEDTVSYYKEILSTHPARFYVPRGDETFFDSFFEKLESAVTQEKIIRILHYGDSQIEMDRISSDLRSFFQSRFGGGGPGLLPLVQTIPTPSVYQQATGEMSDYALYGTGLRTNTRNYGLMARFYRVSGTVAFSVSAANNTKIDKRLQKFSDIKLLYSSQSSEFSATLKDRNTRQEYKQTSECAGLQLFHWHLDTPMHRFTVTFHGPADIYGIMVDDGYGVNVDNIPIRGSSGTFFSQIQDSLLGRMYEMADVGMIVLQFGGNSVPGISSEKGVESFKSRIASQIRYLRKAYPSAKIVFIGPSDMSTRVGGVLQTYPRLPQIIEALKLAALENGAAFWDMYDVMGGHNSMITWVKNGYAVNDYIHFTPAGASLIGKTLSDSFSVMYDFYRTRKNMSLEAVINSAGDGKNPESP